MFKFIHAADIHLDSPLLGLQQYDEAPVDLIRMAPRRALVNLVTLAIDQQVDFVIIAGDLFDGTWTDPNTGFAFVAQMGRLKAKDIPVFLIRGNHDAQSKMQLATRLPENVVLLSHKKAHSAQHPRLEQLGVAIHGRSFAKQAELENIVPEYPQAVAGKFNIGILHTSLTGREGHDTYAPCTIQDLVNKQYDYWALGHVHLREQCHSDPPIVFPGNIQGRHIRETGPKGCYLVTVDDSQKPSLEFMPTDAFRWDVCTIDVSDCESIDHILDQFALSLKQLEKQHDPHSMAIRVELHGRTKLHHQLLSNIDRIRNELQSRAIEETLGKVWIEKLKIRTTVPAEILREHSDEALSEINDYFEHLSRDPNERQQWAEAISPLMKKLPDEIINNLDIDIATIGMPVEKIDERTLFDEGAETRDRETSSEQALIDSVQALLTEQFAQCKE
jgi:DNA repair protein SbcD/Mre11